MTANSGQRVIVIAVDASDNAKDAFDCMYIARLITVLYLVRQHGNGRRIGLTVA